MINGPIIISKGQEVAEVFEQVKMTARDKEKKQFDELVDNFNYWENIRTSDDTRSKIYMKMRSGKMYQMDFHWDELITESDSA